MSSSYFNTKSVKELQQFLKNRGVIFSDQKKIDLVELCENCVKLNIEVDPDGLLEDKDEVLRDKLHLADGTVLPQPDTLSGDNDISILPPFGIFDFYNYFKGRHEYDHATLRNCDKMEGFGMFKDGYVLDIESVPLQENYVALRSKVKPRTNENDPISKLGYYKLWIILSTTEEAMDKGTILSALCSCKGGIDGACRHVACVLFEVMDYISDKHKDSATSGPCMWTRRNTKKTQPVLVTELETNISVHLTTPKPLEDVFSPVPTEETFPDPDHLIAKVKEVHPGACVLDAWEPRIVRPPSPIPLEILVLTDKIESFWMAHSLHLCSGSCYLDFVDHLQYSSDEIVKIEEATQGQHTNCNWTKARHGILTSSNFKTICHSTNRGKTASNLLSVTSLDESNLPEPLLYGRGNENKARDMFIKTHRYRHRKFEISQVGVIITHEHPYLGSSPDGIVKFSICGTFLIEIKCMYTNRNFFRKPALLAAKICELDENEEMKIIKSHKYNYQIQGQTAITGIRKCILIGYTNRGIHSVTINFDEDMWNSVHKNLSSFYKEYYIPTYLKNKDILFSLSQI